MTIFNYAYYKIQIICILQIVLVISYCLVPAGTYFFH